MRRILKPAFDPKEVFDTCVNGVGDPAARMALQKLSVFVPDWDETFCNLAITQGLFQIAAMPRGHSEAIVAGEATKAQFVDLYDHQMAKNKRPGRSYYDKVLGNAPHRKCPLCGFGQATTLDHYLPKARFPKHSVTLANLVPSCRDCQSEKKADVALSFEEQPLHPYFDPDRYFERRWLFARVEQGDLPSLVYYVEPQGEWDARERARLAGC